MIKIQIQWVLALAVMGLFALPAVAARSGGPAIEAASFGLRSAARVSAFDSQADQRVHVRFAGEGQAEVSADGASLSLDTLTQVDGDGTLTVTPDGDLTRRGRSRVFMGTGTAAVESDDGTLTFENVRIVIKLRGHGARLRLIGVFRGNNPSPAAEDGSRTPPAEVLRGRLRGQRVAADAE